MVDNTRAEKALALELGVRDEDSDADPEAEAEEAEAEAEEGWGKRWEDDDAGSSRSSLASSSSLGTMTKKESNGTVTDAAAPVKELKPKDVAKPATNGDSAARRASGMAVQPPSHAPATVTMQRRSSFDIGSNTAKDFMAKEYLDAIKPLYRGHSGEHVPIAAFVKGLAFHGLIRGDCRLDEMFASLDDLGPTARLIDIASAAVKGGDIILSALQDRLIIPGWEKFTSEIRDIAKEVDKVTDGHNAAYIPQLANVDPSLFAVSITTIDGQRYDFGDADVSFCLQSVSKPVSYAMALEEHGPDKVHDHIGREPSGQSFNEMVLKKIPASKRSDPKRQAIPHNPLINAGAIVATSLLHAKKDMATRLVDYIDTWSRLSRTRAGMRCGFDAPVFLSERSCADRNSALAYMMKENGSFNGDINVESVLEFYFQTCSLTVNSKDLSVAAASLARGGINPFTGDKVFESDVTKNTLTMMLSCGMYDYSGEWAFRIGLPAKSGVSGCVMIVVPNVMGICVYSPRLDSAGNSVKALAFGASLVEKYSFHMFDSLVGFGKSNPAKPADFEKDVYTGRLLRAASQGNIPQIQALLALGVDINTVDYDFRSSLHLAACEGHEDLVEFLIAQGGKSCKDRWGHTPADDARSHGHEDIAKLITSLLK